MGVSNKKFLLSIKTLQVTFAFLGTIVWELWFPLQRLWRCCDEVLTKFGHQRPAQLSEFSISKSAFCQFLSSDPGLQAHRVSNSKPWPRSPPITIVLKSLNGYDRGTWHICSFTGNPTVSTVGQWPLLINVPKFLSLHCPNFDLSMYCGDSDWILILLCP